MLHHLVTATLQMTASSHFSAKSGAIWPSPQKLGDKATNPITSYENCIILPTVSNILTSHPFTGLRTKG